MKSTEKLAFQILSFILANTLISTAVSADFEGRITLGVSDIRMDNANSKFGEYMGVGDDETQLLADFDLSFKPSEHYFKSSGRDLGTDYRALELDWGRYGAYGLRFEYNEIPHLLSVSSRTPFNGVGSDQLTLPSDFVTGSTTGDMTNLEAALKDLELHQDRTNNGLEFFLTPDERWRLEFSVDREEKNGVRALGGSIAPAGRFNASTILPEPVDQSTDSFNTALFYAGEAVQWQFVYHLSEFNNYNAALNWENPFDEPAGATAPYPDRASISLPPDNLYQNLSVSGGINLPRSSRLTLAANYGRMEQDVSLLPYTINPDVTVTEPLPRDSAQARIDISNLDLHLTTRPLSRLSLGARYHYYESDNKTPNDLFLPVVNDTRDQLTEADGTYSVPYDTTRSRFNLNGSYYLGKRTTLHLGYQNEAVERTNREVEETKEDSYSARLNSRFSTYASANLNIVRAKRRGVGDYDPAIVYNSRYTDDYSESDGRYINNPALRRYDVADRDRDTYGLSVNLFPSPSTMVGLYLQSGSEDYPAQGLGLESTETQSHTIDVSYTPPEQGFSLFVYYTREKMAYELLGRYFNAAGPPGTKQSTAEDPTRDWLVNNEDRTDTVGFGGTIRLFDQRLVLSLQYDYSEAENNIDLEAGSSLDAPAAISQDGNTRHRIELLGDFELTYNMNLGVGLLHEQYDINEWARDGIAADSTIPGEILFLEGEWSEYTANVVYTTFTYRW